jgi:hypothetical protein
MGAAAASEYREVTESHGPLGLAIHAAAAPVHSESQPHAKLDLPWIERRQCLPSALIVRVDAPHVRAIEEIEALRDELAVQRLPHSDISLKAQIE